MTDRRTILDLIEDDIYRHTTGAEDPREVCVICGGRIEWRPVVYTPDGPVHDRHETPTIVRHLAEVDDGRVTILGQERALLLTDRMTGGQTVRVGDVAETVDGDDWLAVALDLWAEVAA